MSSFFFVYLDFHRISFTLHARNNTWRVVVNMLFIYLSLSATFSGLPTRLSWADAGSLLCAPQTKSRESMKQRMLLYVFWLGRLREQPVPASSSQLRFGLLFVFLNYLSPFFCMHQHRKRPFRLNMVIVVRGTIWRKSKCSINWRDLALSQVKEMMNLLANSPLPVPVGSSQCYKVGYISESEYF